MTKHLDRVSPTLLDTYISYCVECERYFDTRSGCPADVAFDEREEIVALVESASTGCNCQRTDKYPEHLSDCPVALAAAIRARNKD